MLFQRGLSTHLFLRRLLVTCQLTFSSQDVPREIEVQRTQQHSRENPSRGPTLTTWSNAAARHVIDDWVLCFLGCRQPRESLVTRSYVRVGDDCPIAPRRCPSFEASKVLSGPLALLACSRGVAPSGKALSCIDIAALPLLCLTSSPPSSCILSIMHCIAPAASAMISAI